MRTVVFAAAAALIVASGLAYSLQATRTSSPSPSFPEQGIPVVKVQSVSVLERDAPQEKILPAAAPLKASLTDYDVERAPIAEAEDHPKVGIATTVSENGPPAPLTIAAVAEQPANEVSSDQPAQASASTKRKSAKTTAKKPASDESANSEPRSAKAAGKKGKDQAVASKQEPTPASVQAASAPDSEFPNPIAKLRQFFGVD
jgi:hypothetical protein